MLAVGIRLKTQMEDCCHSMPVEIHLPRGNGEVRLRSRLRQAPPVALVIFGASGDLARRKLVPALFDLHQAGLLGQHFAVLGFSRSALSDEDFRESLREGVQQFARHKAVDEPAWQEFSSALHYQRGQFDDPSSYRELADRLAKIDGEHGMAGNRLFYLATPPEVFPVILQQLGAAGLNRPRGDGFVRIVVEKPFGTDLESARQLNHQIQKVFTETQVYRIDHYLAGR